MNVLTKHATETPDGRYAYLGPLYRQVKQAAWDALKLSAEAPTVTINETDLVVRFPNKARVQLFGADNYQALRGMHLDGIVLDEYADINPAAWTEVIRPALARKQGFATFIGTPKGRNHFYRLYEDAKQDPAWFTALYRHEDSGVITEDEIALARRQMTEDHFAQEYECSWEAAIHGAYYARQLEACRAEGRIKTLTWEPTLPVDTYWDLGYTDATAVIFVQRVAREIHVLDYLEDAGQGLEYYAKLIAQKPYLYGTHILPHDAGYQQQASAGVTLEQQLRALGVKPTRVERKSDVEAGINEARLMFPRLWFDADKAARLVDALAAYHAKWDDDRKTLLNKPEHDWSSHGADAFRLLAVASRDFRPVATTRNPSTTVYHPYTHERVLRKTAARPSKTKWSLH